MLGRIIASGMADRHFARSLLSPGWRKEWHVGIRSGNTLCAFISAIPTQMRVRSNVIPSAEVNFLCIHKKLRGKRLAPVLIKEITRRVNLEGTWQAIYTGGIVLPRPVSTCRYYHRALNWMKLYEVGFSPCPPNSKPAYQARKYNVPENTSTRGLREMEAKDLDAVKDLLERYLKRFDLTPVWDKNEVEHWLLHKKDGPGEQVIWCYVVEVRDAGLPVSMATMLTHALGRERQNHRLLLLLLPRVLGYPVTEIFVHPRRLSVLLCE